MATRPEADVIQEAYEAQLQGAFKVLVQNLVDASTGHYKAGAVAKFREAYSVFQQARLIALKVVNGCG